MLQSFSLLPAIPQRIACDPLVLTNPLELQLGWLLLKLVTKPLSFPAFWNHDTKLARLFCVLELFVKKCLALFPVLDSDK